MGTGVRVGGGTVMTMRERFTPPEWSLVVHIPFDAFLFAAAADNDVDEAEVGAFVDTLRRASEIKEPLHREVALFWARSPERIGEELKFQMRESATEMTGRIGRTKPILHERLSDEEYQSFMLSLTMSALAVAAASTKKKGLFGKREAISKEEQRGVSAFAAAWGLNAFLLQQRLAGVS
jgi:hypothetical protein